ncbi:MAG: hypothetical protein OXF05_07845 [Hyphomicrobiales bacterium]|nr:hypothetical protein [Hyphomicrobiales bacterium]
MQTIITAITIALATTSSDNEAHCFNLTESENEVVAIEAEVAKLKDESDGIQVKANRLRMEAKYNKEGYKTFRYSPDSGFKEVETEGFVQAHEDELKTIEMLKETERIRIEVERLIAKVDHLRRQAEAHQRMCEGN